MTAPKHQLYEGMFLFNNAVVGSDLNKATTLLREILDRAGAEIDALLKWDDRRLAYPIKGQKRGLYLLTYFRVSGGQIANIERDVNLSEEFLRCMIVRADHIGEVELEQARKKEQQTLDAASLAESEDQGSEQPAAKETEKPAPQAEVKAEVKVEQPEAAESAESSKSNTAE
jgi:small subunit ribosomal protein S6